MHCIRSFHTHYPIKIKIKENCLRWDREKGIFSNCLHKIIFRQKHIVPSIACMYMYLLKSNKYVETTILSCNEHNCYPWVWLPYRSKHEINDCSLQTIRAFWSNKCPPIRMGKSVRYFRFCFQYTCNWKIKSIVSMWMALVEVKTIGVHKSNPAFIRIDMNTNVWYASDLWVDVGVARFMSKSNGSKVTCKW